MPDGPTRTSDRAARGVPIRFTLGIVALCLLLGEWFPFSRFPMYSVLPPSELYYYLADEADRAIPTTLQFGLSTRFIKKAYRSSWNRVRDEGWRPEVAGAAASPAATLEEEAGVRLLRYLLRHRRPRVPGPAGYRELRLYRVTIRVENGSFIRERAFVARLAVPDTGAGNDAGGRGT